VRPLPKPGQVIAVTTTQDMRFAVTRDTPANESATPIMQMSMKTELGFTQTNGEPNDRGQIQATLAIDAIGAQETINGTAKPSIKPDLVVGKSVTAVFDRDGRLVDVIVPQNLSEASAVLKQMIAAAFAAPNFMPAATLAVGEKTTVPSAIPMRIPGAPPGTPLVATTTTTLKAIEGKGADRTARFAQQIASAADVADDQLKIAGNGTIDVNLARGFVAASDLEWTFDGPLASRTGASAAQSQTMHGTMKVTVTGRQAGAK